MTDTYKPFAAINYNEEALQSDALESEAAPAEGPGTFGNLMSVLAPATPPPPPLNARVICRMGLNVPKPREGVVRTVSAADGGSSASGDAPGLFTKRRQRSRLLRGTSLRAAAQLD